MGLVLLGACSLFVLRNPPIEDYRNRPTWVHYDTARQYGWIIAGHLVALVGIVILLVNAAGTQSWIAIPFVLIAGVNSYIALRRSRLIRARNLIMAKAAEDKVVGDTTIPDSPKGL